MAAVAQHAPSNNDDPQSRGEALRAAGDVFRRVVGATTTTEIFAQLRGVSAAELTALVNPQLKETMGSFFCGRDGGGSYGAAEGAEGAPA
mmetsp:Transcript_99284/g.227948  ORF Transcript_99284/g.227948 Transcript_99284/m.227948 type:complete len:90 (-) Transcript_99284:245-514(-)